jgi:hypothetical protein
MSRKALPSIRTKLVKRCCLPVQWVVSTSVSLSPGDQMLKYGSQATNGTDGGRNVSACGCYPADQREKETQNKFHVVAKRLFHDKK